MTAKIVSAILTFIVNAGVGVVMVFFMLIALNGFSERAASYAFVIFIGGASLVSLLTAAGAFMTAGFLLKKNWSGFAAGALPAVVFVGAGAILKIVVFLVAVLVADSVRTAR
ncbi:MAG: hypothetical protein JSS81_19455 [Acidobacteria bacterium]|nr:hypothetical protein [Acidobacteriota bacterium]